jgi:hypothetical protein
MSLARREIIPVLIAGIAIGILLSSICGWNGAVKAAFAETGGAGKMPDVASLAADVEVLKAKATDQSHVMKDVSEHFGNLWFAAEAGNWPLADFFLSETHSHLKWAVRVIPKRKDNAGKEIDLVAILQAVENSPLKQLESSVKAKDKVAFEKAYRFMLEGCYSCHKAADKPYLRPQIPTRPETAVLNFDPDANWPK